MNWMSAEYVSGLASVIIPAYNRADVIGETLESVRAQSYRPIEIIVVDDGSTDHTAEVVRQFAEANAGDLVVRCIQQKNQGAASARNQGLMESRGEFIQFLDSDDLLHPGKLSSQVPLMREEPDVQFVFSRWEHFGEAAHDWSAYWAEDFDPGRDNLIDLILQKDRRHYLPLCSGNALLRRALCERTGPWDTQLRSMQDMVYNMRVLMLGVRHRYLPEVHLRVRRDTGPRISGYGSTQSFAGAALGWSRIREMLERAGDLSPKRRCLLGKARLFLAWAAFAGGATDIGRAALADGLAVAPASHIRLALGASRLLAAVLGTRGARMLATAWKALPGGLKRALKW